MRPLPFLLLLSLLACAAQPPEWTARNAVHGIDARLTPRGVTLALGSGAAVELQLVAAERGDASLPLGEGRVRGGAGADRAELHRSGVPIVEWYVNDARGVEQGFDVATDPLPGEGALRFVFETRGLSPVAAHGGASVEFHDAAGRRALALGSLVAFDARRRPLGARMLVADGRLVYEIDDRGARYPIVVDPLATTPGFEFVGGASGYQASIATSGDVNGDGYSDLLVGADDGYAYLFLGSATGLSPLHAWRALVDPDSAAKGVVSVGDVNGDGFDDVLCVSLLGAAQDSGSAFLWLGSATIDVEPDGTPANADWKADSLQEGAGSLSSNAKISASSALDLNADGFADVAIGWPSLDVAFAFANEGSVHVWLGSSDFASRPDGTPANSDWRADGPTNPDTGFGAALAGSGDLNGDGFDDLVVGAPLNSAGNTGNVLVYLGSSAFASEPDGTLASADWSYASLPVAAGGSSAGADFANAGDVDGDGRADLLLVRRSITPIGLLYPDEVLLFRGHASSVLDPIPLALFTAETEYTLMTGATAGDVNGDGLADVVIGRSGWGGNGNPGSASVHLGRLGAPPDAAPAQSWTGVGDFEYSGRAVATAGDVNGDGFSDVAVMGTVARVFLGGGSHATPVDDYLFAAVDGAANQGSTPIAGISHGMAGDVDGDGYGDFVVGIGGADEPGLIDAGRFEVAYGGPCGPACGPTHTQGPGFFAGDQAGEGMGWAVAGAGDVNGDGYDDIVVGSPYYDLTEGSATYTDLGRVRVYYGGLLGLSPSAYTTLSTHFRSSGIHFGASVAGAGDVNADGYADVIVGTPEARLFSANEGVIQVFLGSAAGIATTTVSYSFSTAEARVGASVASAGDVNGDGYSDVIFGAPGRGRAYVFRGGPFGATSQLWTADGLPGSEYGLSVGSAGDVNRDGYADILVGQPGSDADGIARVFVYQGSPTGPSLTPDLTLESALGDRFGSGVASAGDVDGDGYSDAIVGAHWYSGSIGFAEGRASIVYGSASGLDPARTQPLGDCETAPCDYGRDVSGAGDVNGDGFADVLIGAFSLANPNFGDGGVFVHFGNGGTGATRQVQQTTIGGTPIGLLGSTGDVGVARVGMRLSSPAGRSRVWLESELERFGTPLDGQGTVVSPIFDTGALSVAITNFHSCPLNRACHWRARIRGTNPLFPRSPWFSPAWNGPEQADLRGPVGPDADGDEVADGSDNCPAIANADQADADFDFVGDVCDNCTAFANPRVAADFLTTNPWATLTGGQRDDDHDGYGNKCDAKFPGTLGTAVGASDLAQFRASNGKNRTGDTCGTTGTRPCAIFDLDEGIASAIGAPDLAQFRLLNGKVPGPKCAACPLACQSGSTGTCGPIP